jgi:hypothetical protein
LENAVFVTPSADVKALAATELVAFVLNGVVGSAAMTSTDSVHELFAGIVAPLKLTDVAVLDVVPRLHVVAALGVGEMASCAGNESVMATFVSGTPLLFGSVIVSRLALPLPCTFVGANALLAATGANATTVNVACADCVLLPCEELTAPAGMVLTYVPATDDTTSTLKVHVPGVPVEAGIVAPVREALVAPAVAFTVPLTQVVLAFGIAATTTLLGRLSVSDVPVALPTFVLISVTVSVDVWPTETEMGLNPLLTPTSAHDAVAVPSSAITSAARATGPTTLEVILTSP